MLIDIKDIAREGLAIDRVLRLAPLLGEGDEAIVVGPTRITGFFSRGRRGVDFSGSVESRLRLDCVRCLEPFDLPLAAEFHLLFVSRLPQERSRETQLDDSDCDLYPVPEGRVNVAEVAREQLYLGLPPKPLCREDCKGLCPGCGVNRNVTSCSCPAEEPGPRNPIPIPFPARR